MATKQQLKSIFVDGATVTGAMMSTLIDSLKGVQSPVSDPAASGSSTTFIATITQDAEGNIVVTKKNVNLSGYQTTAGMAVYQAEDLQKVGDITVGVGSPQYIVHNMKHYPTVRLIADTGLEVSSERYTVKHVDVMQLSIELGGSLTGHYRYILD